jgi:hypothetical protein
VHRHTNNTELLVDSHLATSLTARVLGSIVGQFHMPVNADVADIEVIFVDERNAIINPLGVKGG